jgi:hypothetical protein
MIDQREQDITLVIRGFFTVHNLSTRFPDADVLSTSGQCHNM